MRTRMLSELSVTVHPRHLHIVWLSLISVAATGSGDGYCRGIERSGSGSSLEASSHECREERGHTRASLLVRAVSLLCALEPAA